MSAIPDSIGFKRPTNVDTSMIVALPASPSAYTQTYSTAARTVPNATVTTVATDAAALTSYGFTEAQANAIPVAINALAADVLALKKVVTALIDDLQAAGLAA